MSGSFSYYLESVLLAEAFNGTPYTPGPIFVALFTSFATPSAPGTEVPAGFGYSRLPVVFTTVGAAPNLPPACQSNAVIQWPPAQSAWGTLVSAGLYDAVTVGTGNMLAQGVLVSPVDGITPRHATIEIGDVFRFPAGGIQVGFAIPPTPPAPLPFGMRATPSLAFTAEQIKRWH